MNPLAAEGPTTSDPAARFAAKLREYGVPPLHADRIETLQVNVGKLCNQACRHCHVDAGPHQHGSEVNMGTAVADQVIALLPRLRPQLLDITGGAPELNPNFRRLVVAARAAGIARVMDRCNLSVLFEPGQEDLATFLAEHRVEVTASLPHYDAGPTDRQRGAGVFDRSLEGLRRLNALGYGRGGSLILNLVHNAAGAFLPARQAELELDYKRELKRRFDVDFDHLFCITNMPIARFAQWLRQSGNYERYMQVLVDAFNPAAVAGLMCRNLVSVGPDGTLYDCDFNQMLGLPLHPSRAAVQPSAVEPGSIRGEAGAMADHPSRAAVQRSAVEPGSIRCNAGAMADDPSRPAIAEFDIEALQRRRIVTGDHCLGCTAGAGSSCGGQTSPGDAVVPAP
ncbi:MAG: arsenosugar biosynthesis radical SAM protein ArsS [Planctomycetota bacterium]